jgi:hypothetical protein
LLTPFDRARVRGGFLISASSFWQISFFSRFQSQFVQLVQVPFDSSVVLTFRPRVTVGLHVPSQESSCFHVGTAGFHVLSEGHSWVAMSRSESPVVFMLVQLAFTSRPGRSWICWFTRFPCLNPRPQLISSWYSWFLRPVRVQRNKSPCHYKSVITKRRLLQ